MNAIQMRYDLDQYHALGQQMDRKLHVPVIACNGWDLVNQATRPIHMQHNGEWKMCPIQMIYGQSHALDHIGRKLHAPF